MLFVLQKVKRRPHGAGEKQRKTDPVTNDDDGRHDAERSQHALQNLLAHEQAHG